SKWQHTFDSPATDLFALPSDIAARTAEALGVAVGAGERGGLGERTTQSLEAYEAFHRGEETSNSLAASDPESLRRAIGFYEQAVALDPEFALAWAQLARANALDFFVGTPSPTVAARAREAAERAMALAPEHARSHLALGDVERWVAKDSRRALELYIQGWRRAPGDAELLSAAARG